MYHRRAQSFTRRRLGFTLVELLVVLAILAVVVSILIPVVQSARLSASRSHCASNLHHIGIGYQALVDAAGSKPSAFVGDDAWVKRLLPYTGDNRQLFVCPAQADASSTSLGPGAESFSKSPTSVNAGAQQSSNQVVVTPNSDGTLTIRYSGPNGSAEGDNPNLMVLISPLFGEDMPAASLPDSSQATLRVSYGVNNAVQYFGATELSQKVLVVEYKHLIANVVGVSAPDFWPVECAPRHQGLLNVLFADGTVRGMTQHEIDPRVAEIYKNNWLPQMSQD
jgi:prepilin-type N-terminal cleavage/methylation domain-containing protein/prepilin-type processing-associated H-X9-DG protein